MGTARQAGTLNSPDGRRPWAARIARSAAAAAAVLRLLPGVEAAEQSGAAAVWLRGPDLTDDVDAALRRVPGIERFLLFEGDRLAEPGARVPCARLPSLAWSPVARMFGAVPPVDRAAGERPDPARIGVGISAAERPFAALLTDATSWERWCATAPAVRLARLSFAACADARVLVRGVPPPPIAGATPLWEDAGVLVPCGWAPDPDVGGAALRIALGLGAGDVAILGADGEFDVVRAAHFATATRSAARLTRRRVAGG